MNNFLRRFREEGGSHQDEVVAFAPVKKSKLDTVTQVTMIASVGGKHEDGTRWEFVAGTEQLLDPKLADKFIVNGWAIGELSRKYSPDEILEIRSRVQDIRPHG